MTLVGYVYDRYASGARATKRVNVTTPSYSSEELATLTDSLMADAFDSGDSSAVVNVVSSVASVLNTGTGTGDDDAADDGRNISAADTAANTALRTSLLTSVAAAASSIDLTTSAAVDQASAVVAACANVPGELDATAQALALGLAQTVASGASGGGNGISEGAASSVGSTLSNLLETDLFGTSSDARRRRLQGAVDDRRRGGRRALLASDDNATDDDALDDAAAASAAFQAASNFTDTLGALADAQLATRYAGMDAVTLQSGNIGMASKRDAPGDVSSSPTATPSGTAVAMPNGFADAIGAGSAGYLDIKAASMEINPYEAAGGDAVVSPVTSIDVGADGAGQSVSGLTSPIAIVIPLAYAMADVGTNLSWLMRAANCTSASEILWFDDCPTSAYSNVTYDCATDVFAETPDGRNVTLTAPYVFDFTCPYEAPTCEYWDVSLAAWSSEGCVMANRTAHNVTCLCTHLTAFGSRAAETAAVASTVVSLAGDLTLSDLLAVLGVIVTLFVVLGSLVFGCWYGRLLDVKDAKAREQANFDMFQAVTRATVKEEKRKKAERGLAQMLSTAPSTERPAAKGGNVFRAFVKTVFPKRPRLFIWLENAWAGIKEEHKLVSIIYASNQNFTRPERITVLACIVMGTLLSNSLLFEKSSSPPDPDASLEDRIMTQAFFAIVTAILQTPVSIIFGIIFQRTGSQFDPEDFAVSEADDQLDAWMLEGVHRKRDVIAAREVNAAAKLHLDTLTKSLRTTLKTKLEMEKEKRRLAVAEANALIADEKRQAAVGVALGGFAARKAANVMLGVHADKANAKRGVMGAFGRSTRLRSSKALASPVKNAKGGFDVQVRRDKGKGVGLGGTEHLVSFHERFQDELAEAKKRLLETHATLLIAETRFRQLGEERKREAKLEMDEALEGLHGWAKLLGYVAQKSKMAEESKVHTLTRDQQYLYRAEKEELKQLGLVTKTLYMQFLSPLKKSYLSGSGFMCAMPPHCRPHALLPCDEPSRLRPPRAARPFVRSSAWRSSDESPARRDRSR